MTEPDLHPSENGLAAPAAMGAVGAVRVAPLRPAAAPALVAVLVLCVGLGLVLLRRPALEAAVAATLDGRALLLDALRSSALGLALGFPAGLALALLADLGRSGRRARRTGLTQLATSWLAAPAALLALLAVGMGALDAQPTKAPSRWRWSSGSPGRSEARTARSPGSREASGPRR